MMLTWIKQHLNYIWSSIHEKVKRDWGWVEQKALLIKKACIQLQIKLSNIFFNKRFLSWKKVMDKISLNDKSTPS